MLLLVFFFSLFSAAFISPVCCNRNGRRFFSLAFFISELEIETENWNTVRIRLICISCCFCSIQLYRMHSIPQHFGHVKNERALEQKHEMAGKNQNRKINKSVNNSSDLFKIFIVRGKWHHKLTHSLIHTHRSKSKVCQQRTSDWKEEYNGLSGNCIGSICVGSSSMQYPLPLSMENRFSPPTFCLRLGALNTTKWMTLNRYLSRRTNYSNYPANKNNSSNWKLKCRRSVFPILLPVPQ